MQNGTENIEARIVELYESGDYSKTGICQELGVGKKKLYRVLREQGLVEPEGTNPPVAVKYEEDSEDSEDGELEYQEPGDVPAPIVLGSGPSALVGLASGAVLGAAALYYAMMRGLVAPPSR